VGFRKAGVWLGLVEEDDEVLIYDEYLSADSYADEDQPPGRVAPLEQTAVGHGFQIATVRPQTFRDAHTIGEYFLQDIPVIINLVDLDRRQAERFVDFASGLIFGRRGDIERLSSRIFLILPIHSRILREPGTSADEGFFNQT
jgi:cell division inhibitor SepF